jgi:dephospho-CoA kinase
LADEKAVRERLKQSRKMTDLEITSRLNAQLCQDEKAAKSDIIIDNSRDLEHTKAQIITHLKDIRKTINTNIH